MSDDEDRIAGFNASARGAYPDWGNVEEVRWWQSAESFKAQNSTSNQPPSSTNDSHSSDNSLTYIPPSSSYSSTGYSSTSSRRGYTSKAEKWKPSEVVCALALFGGGYAGYTTGVTNHWSTLKVWLAAGGFAVAAAFIWLMVIELIKDVVKNLAAKKVKKGLGSSSASSASSSQGDTSDIVFGLAFFLALFLGGFLGYLTGGLGVLKLGSTLDIWLTVGIGALGTAVVTALVVGGITSLVAEIRQG